MLQYHRRMTGAKNTLWDQHTLTDVVETSVTGIESRRRSYSISLRNEDRDVWFKHHGYATETRVTVASEDRRGDFVCCRVWYSVQHTESDMQKLGRTSE